MKDLPARCAFMKSKVVPSKLTVTPTPPLFPTRPPMSPVVTADLDMPEVRCQEIVTVERGRLTSNKWPCLTVDEDSQIQPHHTFFNE